MLMLTKLERAARVQTPLLGTFQLFKNVIKVKIFDLLICLILYLTEDFQCFP